MGLLPREDTAEQVVWCEVDPCYVFHPLNAYEQPDGRVVVDVVRHPRMFAGDLNGPNVGAPTLDRWTLDPRSGRAREERLDDRGQEFPRHDERVVGRPYRYGYTAEFGDGLRFGALLKHDLRDGKTGVHDEGPGRVFLEPVFVPRRDDAAEDDGWVMAWLYDAGTRRSEVLILHAQGGTGRHHPPARTGALRLPRELGAGRGLRPAPPGARHPPAGGISRAPRPPRPDGGAARPSPQGKRPVAHDQGAPRIGTPRGLLEDRERPRHDQSPGDPSLERP